MAPESGCGDVEALQLEDFRPGYPRYAALLSADPNYHIFRRFTRARQRLLLLKQDEICRLEESLDSIDDKDPNGVFLGCNRIDGNQERHQKLKELSKSMAEYDALFEHSHHVFTLQKAASRNVNSLRNWIAGTGNIQRQETTYLNKRDDLVNLVSCNDGAMERVGWFLEDLLAWFHNKVRIRLCGLNSKKRMVTADEHVFFFGPGLQSASRALMAWFTTLVLLVPVIVLNSLSTMVGRFVTIVIAAGIFVFAVSFITKAKTSDVFLSGAAYAAVLVVFTSNNNGLSTSQDPQLPPKQSVG